MTYVVFAVDPNSLGYTNPITEQLVSSAAPHILTNLQSVSSQYHDIEMRANDPRRTHGDITESQWRVKFKGNKFIVTNEAASRSSQVEALAFGNGDSPIKSTRPLQYRPLKGWSEKDRHKDRARGGKKTKAGELSAPYLPKLKFWSKRDGMFLYRNTVQPISAAIVDDFNRSVQTAILLGLESAAGDVWDEFLYGDSPSIEQVLGIGETEPADEWMYEDTGEYIETLEEYHLAHEENRSAVESNDLNYGMRKTEEDAENDIVARQKESFIKRVDTVHKPIPEVEIERKLPQEENVISAAVHKLFGLWKR